MTGNFTGRGVWHSRPTTRNEAVGESGKQGLISPAYLPFYQALTPLFLWFAVMVIHDTSHKQVFHHRSQPLVSCSRPRESLPLQSRTNNLFNIQVN